MGIAMATWDQDKLDELLDNGLSVLHLKLMLYLLENGAVYVHDVSVDNPKLYRRFVELAMQNKPEFYEKIELEPISLIGAARPRKLGIKLTKEGKRIASRLFK